MDGHPHLNCRFDTAPLAEAVARGVREALADEWKAEATYAAFAIKVGPPFTRLKRAEDRHADLLVQLLSAHEASAPSRPETSVAEVASPAEACKVALDAEKANVALYDKLLATSPPEDVRCVYEHLRSLSAERHIPALERCGGGPP